MIGTEKNKFLYQIKLNALFIAEFNISSGAKHEKRRNNGMR